MDEPDWAELLELMYNNQPPFDNGPEQGYYSITWLSEESGLDREKIHDEVKRLSAWGLVENHPKNSVNLLKDGFDVAHERELNRRNTDINYSLLVLTVFLVLSQIVGVVPVSDLGKFTLGGAILVLLGVLIWRADLLDR